MLETEVPVLVVVCTNIAKPLQWRRFREYSILKTFKKYTWYKRKKNNLKVFKMFTYFD